MNTKEKTPLEVSDELWSELGRQSQQLLAARYALKVLPSFAPAPDLDMPIELVMVPRHA